MTRAVCYCREHVDPDLLASAELYATDEDSLAEIHAEAPDLRLELREEQTDPLQALIARGELDVGVLALPVSGDGFEEHVLFYEPFVLAAPRGHALDRPGPVTAQEIEGHQLLLMTEGHCFRDHALAACAEAGAIGRADLTATSLTTLIMMVQGGLGATLLPASALSSIPVGPQLALRSFSSPPTRAIGLRWRRTSPRGESYRALGTLMVEHLLRRPLSAEVQGPAPVFCVADA